MEQQIQISPIEARILSEITPEEAHDLLLFMRTIPAPKQMNSSLPWEDSHYLDQLMNTIRTFLSIRAGMGGAK